MIQINLLPDNGKAGNKALKSPGKPGRPATSGGGGAGSFVITVFALLMFSAIGAAGYTSWNSVHEAKVSYEKLQAEKKAVDSEVSQLSAKAKEMQHLREVFNSQMDVLQSLDPPNRILWCEKVNMLANLIPSDVFLTKLNLTEQVVDVETQASVEAREKWEKGGKKGEKPPIAKRPVISYTFKITGIATGAGNVEQFDNVIKFHDAIIAQESMDATGQKRHFMDNFDPNISFERVEATLYEGQPVNEFTFKLVTKALGAEPKPATPKPTDTADAPAAKSGAKPAAGKGGTSTAAAKKPAA